MAGRSGEDRSSPKAADDKQQSSSSTDETDAALRSRVLEASMLEVPNLGWTMDALTAGAAALEVLALLLLEVGVVALGAQLPSSITHGVWVIERNKGLKAVHALHHTTNPPPRCLVFVNSPHRAKVVCQKLWEAYGIAAAPLYGEQEREERVDVMRRLLDGRVRIAVTTEMGARGLDIPGLTHVINLELPTDPQHYVHRAGRCGRAGKDGTVLSLAPPGKAFVVASMASGRGLWRA